MASPTLPQSHLQYLTRTLPTRRVGSDGNRAATHYFAQTIASFGFQVEQPTFDCMDWTSEGATLTANGEPFEVFPSPYTVSCQVRAPFVTASTLPELEAVDAGGKILLVRGSLAREPLMPKNFPFYNPDEHKQIIHLLEAKAPLAILTATARNPEMVGALYPFPMLEDGDFDIPSAYMTEEEGARLALVDPEITLEIQAQRIPSTGCNVVAPKLGTANRRVVLFAHIDAKPTTPGALDNATGVTTLLLLAELLAGYTGELGIEIVALNGEDYYDNPGEKLYLAQNEGRFDEITLGINLDGLGYREGRTAFSLYECPDEMAGLIRRTFAAYPDLVEGPPWYQGDHFLFLMHQRPALAITSERVEELMANIVHTERDTPDILDPAKLAGTAAALRDLILTVGTGATHFG